MQSAPEFDQFYRDNLHYIQKYLARRVSFDSIDDLAAEVFDIAYRRRSQAKVGFELPWLYRIAGFVVANHRRKTQRESRMLPLLGSADTAASAEQLAMAHLELAEAWQKLRMSDRAVLSLAAFEGLSVAEISIALDISKNAVNLRLHRARKELANLLNL